MQNSIVKLELVLVEKLSELIFGKRIEYVDEVEFELKKILHEYGILDIDFLSVRQLTEAVCTIKGINYEVEFIDTGLSSMFSNKILDNFITPKMSELSQTFDKDAIHNIVIIELNKIVKSVENTLIGNLSETNNTKYSFRFEVTGSGKTGSVKYFIQKNKKDAYCLSATNLHENDVYFKRFQCLEIDINKNLPPTFKNVKNIKVNHSYIPKTPYMNGFYLKEIEQVLIIFETYINETMAE